MRPLRLFTTVQWKVVVIYMLLILMAMQFIGAYFARQVESYYLNNFSETVNAQASLLATHLEGYLRPRDAKEQSAEEVRQGIDNLINNLVKLNGTNVQVIDSSGTVISTTEDKRILGRRTSQPEVTIALLGTRSESMRIDPRTGDRVKMLVLPVKGDNIVYGAVYMVASMEGTYMTIRKMNGILASGTMIALLLTAGLGVVLARTITTPVKEMTRQARAVADGDFNRNVRVYSEDEIGQLGMAFNHMTRRLKEAILQQEEEREKLASILTNMSDGVIAANRDGQIILLNRSAEEMLQVTMNECVQKGTTLHNLLRLPPEEEMPLYAQNEPLFIEMVLPNKDVLILRVTFTPLQHDSGKKGGIIAVLQDVTEQQRLEQQRREFVANVSHELRTPLTTIKSYVEALLDGAVEEPELSNRFLRVTMSETERMIRLVNDLLQLSRFDSQGVRLHCKDVDANQLLRYAVDRISLFGEQQGVQLSLEIQETLPEVHIDKDAINQVLDNLLSNAIKYTPAGGSVVLRAYANRHQKRVYISIADTGIGIPSRDLKRIFERFYRVDKARSRGQGGTGLGLAIARELVQAHGAEIEITSELNQGTTVTFWVPYAKGGKAG
ncbi:MULTISPECIES: cell wall metabolism sensor histidine kinase WalK [Brevibacillus]|jgi:two-component system, OmpR family, sensor histidine kinase VicK|uniref:cell wall metabolism sensor histidine kinase WalK n=1 Tax=Brevibacillus TaxID=55080 RepID=UPI000E3828C5|nr:MULTISPECIES: cell wall metabolism sensor histidine kinase WalK [Bacillales]MBR8661270.1 cell wall metabolism sensor histidine kinase WalK [Brevibacillus sp. NL20B1]REK60811.1 MAG: cell wall metabolism sensor histidine kinase WalK [Brevibacillus sp.]UFJ62185.1 cell wall metabolism sensor histidine kinase WalK [Anoxybacillus sediminis]